MFEIKWKRLNSNDWAARETILGQPAKHSAYAGWLSRCPNASVRRGGAKRYRAMWCVRSGSNPTSEGDRKSTRLNSSHKTESRMPSSA